ncbi:copper resistance protein CopC [Actinokineospora soli]
MVGFLRSLALAVLDAVEALVATAAPASAHAVLVATAPSGYQLLPDSPRELRLTFSEPVDVGLASVRLVSPRGADVPGLGAPVHPDGAAAALSIAIPETLANGTYTAVWRVVSADTHPVQGAFTFSVREATAPAAVATEGDWLLGGLYGVARFLAAIGFALLLGTAFLAAACWPGAASNRGARLLATVGAATATCGSLAALVLYGPYAAGRWVFDPGVLGSRIGVLLAVRVVVLAAAWVFLRRWFGVVRWQFVVAAGLGVAVTWGLGAHGAGDSLAYVTVPLSAVHLVAIAVWLGGLPALGVLLRTGDVVGMRSAVPRFSRIAGVCVAVVVATGVYQSWRQVGELSALVDTAYGWWLLGKVALVALLLGTGYLTRRWVRGQYASETVTKRTVKRAPGEIRRFRTLVAVEMAVAALVLGVTATLVGTEPAVAERDRSRGPAGVEGPLSMAVPFDAGGLEGRGQLALALDPSAVGKNQLHLVLLTPEGKPKSAPEVRAELRLEEAGIGPLAVPLVAGGPGHWLSTNLDLPMPGRWEMSVVVRTTEIDQTTVRIPVNAR